MYDLVLCLALAAIAAVVFWSHRADLRAELANLKAGLIHTPRTDDALTLLVEVVLVLAAARLGPPMIRTVLLALACAFVAYLIVLAVGALRIRAKAKTS